MHEDIFSNQLVIAAVSSWLMEKLKDSKYFPLITTETERLNKLFAATVAALATAGILVTTNWDGSTFTFSIANLTLPTVGAFLWHWVGQYVYMKFAYKGMKALGNGKPNGETPPTP